MSLLQLRVFCGLREQVFSLPEGVQVVGSAVRHGIAVRHPTVAPEHFLIETKNGRCRLAAVGGSLVWLNGVPLAARREVGEGEVIHAGAVGFVLEKPGASGSFRHFVVGGAIRTGVVIGNAPCLLGSSSECQVILPSASISARHAEIHRGAEGCEIVLMAGSPDNLVNGRPFDRRVLVPGDRLDLGGYHLIFDGRNLSLATGGAGAWVSAEEVTLARRGVRLLDRVSLSVRPGELVAIVGPTGAGKSTLLGVLGGCLTPTTGRAVIDGEEAGQRMRRGEGDLGWIPQQDIVHGELTVVEALEYAAKLRMPRGAGRKEIAQRVLTVAAQVGLKDELATPVNRLSGGERKKVSVAAELTGSPGIIFMDEPTSGLDPAAENKMVASMRRLADSGCTVVFSTHRMESLYLVDRLFVISSGCLVFAGSTDDACAFFGVGQPAELFARLEQRTAEEWRSAFSAAYPSAFERPARASTSGSRRVRQHRWQVPVLLDRQRALFASDWRNAFLFLAQPLLIGLLLSWAVKGTLDDSALKLFFAGMATLWLGCSQGAQELVGERAIYSRERMAGLRQRAYVTAKWIFVSVLTLLQSAILYVVARFLGAGIAGDWVWQAGGLAAVALVAAGIGLAISACAGNATQAVLLVPALIIPQIVLSGFTVPASNMSPSVAMVSTAVPTFQLQRILDTSLLWERAVDADLLQNHLQAVENLLVAASIKTGMRFDDPAPGLHGFVVLGIWLVGTWVVIAVALRRAEGMRSSR